MADQVPQTEVKWLKKLLICGIKKTRSIAARWKLNILYAPFYLHFHIYGHNQAWSIFTHMTHFERLLLYRLALQLPAGANLLEVGSYLGASACFLAAGAQQIGGSARVHCVDTWQNETMDDGLRDTWGEFQTNIEHFQPLIVAHRGRSVDVAKTFNEQLDLLFIDADHSYEGCREDVISWLPHLKPNGVLVMHDYSWAEGVKRVVSEFVKPKQKDRGKVLQNTYWTRISKESHGSSE
jgi:predicted O-methyltransferase YrrM